MKKQIAAALLIWALAGCSDRTPSAEQPETGKSPPNQAAAPQTHPAAETAALACAEAWLALVDGGRFAQSWEEAASYLKAAVTKETHVQSFQAARTPLGKLLSRELASRRYTQTLPGAPDGEYVVIQYKSSFANKKSALETITPMLDPDGRWRVSGYFIK